MKSKTPRDQHPRARSVIAFIATLAFVAGCASGTRTGEGARSGAAIGAGIGLLLGVLSGDPDKAIAGLAVGAVSGAGHGAYEGWRQEQDDERTRQLTKAIKDSNTTSQQSNMDDATRQREQLTRFLGVWKMEGWLQESGGQRIEISAQVNGNIEMTYFVELAYIDLQASGVSTPMWGTSTFGYEPGDGYSINTRMNTIPEPLHAENGTFDQASRSFSFSGTDYQVRITFETPDRFTVETTSNGQTVESYRFTRT